MRPNKLRSQLQNRSVLALHTLDVLENTIEFEEILVNLLVYIGLIYILNISYCYSY